MSRQHSSLYLYRDVNTKEMTSPPSYGEATSGPPEDTKVNIEAAPGPGVQQQRPPAAAPPAPAISGEPPHSSCHPAILAAVFVIVTVVISIALCFVNNSIALYLLNTYTLYFILVLLVLVLIVLVLANL